MQKNTSNSGYSYLKQQSEFPQIDLVNPYQLQKGVQFELSKMDDLSGNAYMIALDKALKQISKNSDAYRDLQLANFKEVTKEDEKLRMKQVGKKNDKAYKTDSAGYLKKELKKNDKANVSSKKENAKGKLGGVKEMSQKPKTAAGIKKTMEVPGKEQVLSELRSFLQKKSRLSEDLHHMYTVGQEVKTPDGAGQVVEIVGGTISVKLQEGPTKDYQVNVLNREDSYQVEETTEQPSEKKITKEEVIKKLKEYFSKKKKNEAMDVVQGKTPTGQTVTLGTYPRGQGQREANKYKSQGARTASSTTIG